MDFTSNVGSYAIFVKKLWKPKGVPELNMMLILKHVTELENIFFKE